MGESAKRFAAFEARFDLTAPGATWSTDILNGFSSMDKISLILLAAALVAQYKPFHGVELSRHWGLVLSIQSK